MKVTSKLFAANALLALLAGYGGDDSPEYRTKHQ